MKQFEAVCAPNVWSPASLRFGRGADRPRGSYGSSPDYSIAGSGGSGVDWMIPPVSGGLPPLLCLEDNNYSAYSLRGQRIARACLYICVCVEDGRVAWRETG